MKIYQIKKNYRFAELSPKETLITVINDGFDGKSMADIWGGLQTMTWNFEESKVTCDFPLLYGLIPVMSEKAKKIFATLIPADFVEYLKIRVEDENYYALNILKSYDKLLNIGKSKIDYFSNGEIMAIDKYVLNEISDLSPIFKITQLKIRAFVTEEFKNIVKKEGLTGLEFEECEVVTKGWFGNIFK